MNDLARNAQLVEDANAVMNAARSGYYILGPEVQAFEAEFSTYLGVAHCVGVASGTDALRLALRAVGVGQGDSVALAANAGMYAAAATVDIGARPAWVDVDPTTSNLDPDELARRLAIGDIRAVVATHLYGNMADIQRISSACRGHGVALIEDCAQAAGAHERGVRAGAWGDCGAFSFYPTKNLGAWGDAGAVVTNDPGIARRLRELRQYGWASKYIADRPLGINSRMDELQAAILRLRLPRLDGWNERRRDICRAYAEALPGGYCLVFADGPASVGHLAVLTAPDESARAAAREHLHSHGIATDIHYPIPDHMQKAMATWAGPDSHLPVTEDLARRILTVPCFPDLTENEVADVAAALSELQR